MFQTLPMAAMTATPLGFLFVVVLFWAGKWLGYIWKAVQMPLQEEVKEKRLLQLSRALAANVVAFGMFVATLFFPERLGLGNLRGLGAVSALVFWGLSILVGMREARKDHESQE